MSHLTKVEAQQRASRIRALRGVYATADHLFHDRSLVIEVLRCVDQALMNIGAEPETARRTRHKNRQEANPLIDCEFLHEEDLSFAHTYFEAWCKKQGI